MAASTKFIELHPSGSPYGLARPDWFETTSIAVGFGGDVVRSSSLTDNADAAAATVKQPGWAAFSQRLMQRAGNFPNILVSDPLGSREVRSVGSLCVGPSVDFPPEPHGSQYEREALFEFA